MSSLSSSLRVFAPKFPQTLRKSSISKNPFLVPFKPLFFSSPISFQRLPNPIKSQHQRQEASSSEVDLDLLPPKLQEIVALFQSVSDPKAKYHQLLHYGGQLPLFGPQFRNDDHRVRGCVSQVWVRAFPDPDDPSSIHFEADSDSALTKGLAALLVFGLSGSPATVIARVPPDFVHLLGLRQSLTPSRNNGFLNMLRLMQQKALQLHAQNGNSVSDGVPELEDSPLNAMNGVLEAKESNLGRTADGFSRNSGIDQVLGANGHEVSGTYDVLDGKDLSVDLDGDGKDHSALINGDLKAEVVASSSSDGFSGRRERIRERLERELSPVELEVEDISYQHAGHAGVGGNNSGETHFNVRLVSKKFEGKSMVKRHRLVYDSLREELESGLHALSIVAKTPSEV